MANDQMSLCQLRELATRQQEHIEATQRLIEARQQKLSCLRADELSKSSGLGEQQEKLTRLRESVTAQEMKLRQLRALKGHVQKQRCSNSNLSAELESIRALFSEKEKELSVAFAKVDALTRQLEELRKGNTTNSYHINGITNGKHTSMELEKLRQELMYRTKLSEQQNQDLAHKKGLLSQRQSEMIQIDERISELQQRLARKRQLNQQLSSAMHSNLNRSNHNNPCQPTRGLGLCGGNPMLRSSIGHPSGGHGYKLRPMSANIAAVEPLQRDQEIDLQNNCNNDFLGNKMDPKYQTLPYNTKFGGRQHKMNNYLNEYYYNKSECESPIVNGIQTNSVGCNSNGGVTSVSTNGVAKLAKNCLIEERPSPSGSSCSSEHASLTHQLQHNQIHNFNSRTSPFKSNNMIVNNNTQQQYYQPQKQLQNHYVQQQMQRKQQQNLQQQHLQQQQQQQLQSQSGVPYIDGDNQKIASTSFPTKPLFPSQKCHITTSQNCSMPTTTTTISSNACSLPKVTAAQSQTTGKIAVPKLKPILPPKPSVPVKPVPPPRQTPSIDSVDNAIAVLKTNTLNVDKSVSMTNIGSSTGPTLSAAENYRYPLTNTHRVYNGSVGKSGLLAQQQTVHYNHHHNHQHPYDDKPPSHKRNQELTNKNGPTQDFSNLNGQLISGSDLTSSTSSLSSSLSAYNINASNNNNIINNNSGETKSTGNLTGNANVKCHDNENSFTPDQKLVAKNNQNNNNNNNNNINNNLNDWQKVKRRPMVMDNELEQELAMQIDVVDPVQSKSVKSIDIAGRSEASKTVGPTHLQGVGLVEEMGSDLQTSKCEINKQEKSFEMEKDNANDEINCNYKQIEHAGCTLIDDPIEPSPSPEPLPQSQSQTPEILSPSGKNFVGGIKRTKGNLKSQQHASTKVDRSGSAGSLTDSGSTFGANNTIARRVSFDPLALLLDAALEGELELVKKTANQVPNPSAANDEGITALHNAICAGHFDIVKYLVEMGCDVNAQDSDGWTPLHCAASCNNLSMVKFLVEHGACIFATTLSDEETAAEKCEEDEEGFDGCSQYLYGIQEKLGILNAGIVYAVYGYDSQNSDELSFKEGDRITVKRRGDEQEREWWWSQLKDREGYIPRNLLGLYPRVRPVKEQQQKTIEEYNR